MMSTITFEMTSSMKNAMDRFAVDLVTPLADHYNFDLAEALALLDINVQQKAKTTKAKKEGDASSTGTKSKKLNLKKELGFNVPFLGFVDDHKCQGVKYDSGLFTQCTKKKEGEFDYCDKCQAEAASLKSGKPKYGDIRDRYEAAPGTYSAGGKTEVPLANILGKKAISIETAKQQFDELNAKLIELEQEPLVIPEYHWVLKEAKKAGRPKKAKSTTSSTGGKNVEAGDDLLAAVAEASEAKPEAKPVKKVRRSKKTVKAPEVPARKKIALGEGVIGYLEESTKLVFDAETEGNVFGKVDTDEEGDTCFVEGVMVDGVFTEAPEDESDNEESDNEESDE
jgi:hypothetical protein